MHKQPSALSHPQAEGVLCLGASEVGDLPGGRPFRKDVPQKTVQPPSVKNVAPVMVPASGDRR